MNPSAFIRAAIERELAGRESGVDAAEDRLAASLDRLSREIRGVRLGQQALFAFVDSLVKTLLTCIAEPPRDAYDQAIARGKLRYDRFLKSVGAGMAGDSQAAMTELLKRGRRELTKRTTSGFDQAAHTPAGKARRAPGPRLCAPYSVTPGHHAGRRHPRTAAPVGRRAGSSTSVAPSAPCTR